MEDLSNQNGNGVPKRIVTNPYLKRTPEPYSQPSSHHVETKQTLFLERTRTEVDSAINSHKLGVINPAPIDFSRENQVSAGDLPPAKRLPSNVVTFKSAEILTVSELHACSSEYSDRSIRVTGVVLHRYVCQADGSVCFVLGDPLLAPKPNSTTRHSKSNLTPRKELRTPLHQSVSSQPESSIVTRKRPLVGGDKTPRRLVHVPKSSSKSSQLLGSTGRRPKLSMSPVDTMLTTLSNQRVVLVIANQVHVHVQECGLGDLIMAIGEVQLVNDDSPACPILRLWDERRNAKQEGICDVALSYVRPRILRNVNGSDMRLQYEALKLRRGRLQQMRSASSESEGVDLSGASASSTELTTD